MGLPVHVIKERVRIAQRERENEIKRKRERVYTREIHIGREKTHNTGRGGERERGGEERE